jgi:hypothetical protein
MPAFAGMTLTFLSHQLIFNDHHSRRPADEALQKRKASGG